MKKLAAMSTILFTLLLASQSFGTVVDFTDQSYYWPTWGNGSADDTKDQIGVPNFKGGSVTISDAGYLTGMQFNYTNYTDPLLVPGDLFIDVGADNTWDYLVRTLNSTSSGDYDVVQFLRSFSAIKGDRDYFYWLSSEYPIWTGYNIRDNHPVGWDRESMPSYYYTSAGTSYFSGWGGSGSSIFTLPDINIGSEDLIIAWTITCANDVVYERITNPVPEPAIMLLLGTGMLAMGIFARKKFKK